MTDGHDLNIEEIFHDHAESGSIERVVTRRIFYAVYITALLVAFIFAARVAYIGIYRGDAFRARADSNVNRAIHIPAPRGALYDRTGTPLAINESGFAALLKFSEYLRHKKEIDLFLYETIGMEEEQIREAISRANLEESDTVTLTRELSEKDIIALQSTEIEGLYISDDYIRTYPLGAATAHVVGYVDAENVGRTGLEAYYDMRLAGREGILLRQHNATGDILDFREAEEPVAGKDLDTTLHAGLQNTLYTELERGLSALGRTSGAGIAINPQNGEVLAMVSLPSFDANLFARIGAEEEKKQKNAILSASARPLFNRAISGNYSPGSTVKPLVGVAALAENVIDSEHFILSRGFIEIPNPYTPESPSRFVDWAAHGWVNLREALARSSNIYFYGVGGGFPSVTGAAEIGGANILGLGIERLNIWWRAFGFGSKTDIDLLGEEAGFLPNPEEKEERTGSIWRVGDTYNVSIGQGDLLTTPLQLVNYTAAIANGGLLFRPHLIRQAEPEILNNLTDLSIQIAEAQAGMRDAVTEPYGTARLLATLPFAAAAKTGTAQVSNNRKANAFTVAYAPYEKPEIAIIVLVEDAREGSLNTVPIAQNVLEWYYYNIGL